MVVAAAAGVVRVRRGVRLSGAVEAGFTCFTLRVQARFGKIKAARAGFAFFHSGVTLIPASGAIQTSKPGAADIGMPSSDAAW